MRCAVEWGLLTDMPGIHKLKTEPVDFDWLRPAGADRLLLAAAPELPWLAMFTVALQAGLRRGEQLALRWMDADFGREAIDVRKSVYRGRVGNAKGDRRRLLEHGSIVTTGRHAHIADSLPTDAVATLEQPLPPRCPAQGGCP